MNVYPKAVEAFMSGSINLTSDTIKVLLLDADYTYSSAHEFLSSVAAGARIGTAQTITGKAVTNGVFTSSVDPTFSSVLVGDTVTAILIYKHTGSDATARLLAYIDRRGDMVPMSVATNGGDITLSWPSDRVFKL